MLEDVEHVLIICLPTNAATPTVVVKTHATAPATASDAATARVAMVVHLVLTTATQVARTAAWYVPKVLAPTTRNATLQLLRVHVHPSVAFVHVAAKTPRRAAHRVTLRRRGGRARRPVHVKTLVCVDDVPCRGYQCIVLALRQRPAAVALPDERVVREVGVHRRARVHAKQRFLSHRHTPQGGASRMQEVERPKGGSAVQHISHMMALTSLDEPGVYVCQLA